MSMQCRAPVPSTTLAAILVGSLSLAAHAGPARSVKVISTPEVQSPYEQHVESRSTFNLVTAKFETVPEGQTLFITDLSLRTALVVRSSGSFEKLEECVLEIRDFSDSVIFSRYIPFSNQYDRADYNGFNSLVVAAQSVSVFASAGETPAVVCDWSLNGEGPSLSASIAGYTVTTQ